MFKVKEEVRSKYETGLDGRRELNQMLLPRSKYLPSIL